MTHNDGQQPRGQGPFGLLLASASPRRSELLRRLAFDFEVIPAGVEEVSTHPNGASGLVQTNALLKGRHVAELYPEKLVLGADTTVCLEGEILGKPVDMDAAVACLRRLSGKRHEVFTGIALCWARGQLEEVFVDRSEVVFQTLSDELIHEYIRLVNPLDKAGAYGIQAHREKIIASVVGSVENVMGLPVQRLHTWFSENPLLVSEARSAGG